MESFKRVLVSGSEQELRQHEKVALFDVRRRALGSYVDERRAKICEPPVPSNQQSARQYRWARMMQPRLRRELRQLRSISCFLVSNVFDELNDPDSRLNKKRIDDSIVIDNVVSVPGTGTVRLEDLLCAPKTVWHEGWANSPHLREANFVSFP